MSGRISVTPAAGLQEIPIYLMDATTGEGVTGVDPGDTGFSARFRRAGETTDTPMTLAAVAAGAALAVNQWRDYGDGCYTIVGPTALYAAGARFAKIAVDCTTPATLADCVFMFLSADDALSAAPASVTAAEIRNELLSVRFGAQTVPPGGSQQVLTVTDMPSGTVLGVIRRQLTSTDAVAGQTEMTAS
jgi:hypothetical protein